VSWYDVAQVCRNGHVITGYAKSDSKSRQAHCPDCGAATIDACEQCHTEIRGYLHVPNTMGIPYELDAPAYCGSCGLPYPWTVERLAVAKEMARELEGLTPEQGEQLAATLDDIVTPGPKSELQAGRFKKLIGKAAKPAGEALRRFLIEYGAEVTKRLIEP
jgi:hypothetical protein